MLTNNKTIREYIKKLETQILDLKKENHELKETMKNTNDYTACLEHDTIEQDNKCHECFCNHIGMQSVIQHINEHLKFYSNYNLDNNISLGKKYAYKEVLDFITENKEEPRKIEE